ncbi:hypothetical protein KC19_10G058400 [Ceratodon purpureus]|uniref:Inward rectifier potassium channel C-terminal domain-containing protein n=2 Tax=Ceratodon purpureus TaxID=3225 RepID=A0A8T0GM74_CERPU|nr:hypothetical protein KC19_10G058400 [Ceratodon purpureus]
MSSMTSVFVRPAGSVQGVEICSCVLPVSISRWKDRRLCPGGVGVMGVFDGGRRRMVVQAGLGRYSGAIHGSRSKKSWRRNPSQISEDERNEKELDKLDDHGAKLRGAYGDDVAQDSASVSNRCEDNEEPVVDQFHADGTSESSMYETQFQQSCYADYATNQDDVGEDLSMEIDERMLDNHNDGMTENSNTRNEGLSREDHEVVPITVFDGSGHETRSFVSSDLEDSHGQQGATTAENGGAKDSRTGDEENSRAKNSLAQNVGDMEAGTSQSGTQSTNRGVGESDRSRPGSAKPTMQRRASRGRRKKMPSLSSDSLPITFFPEEVAPVAATILTNPEVFVDPDEKSASNLDNTKRLEKSSKMPSYSPRLKAYDQKLMVVGKQHKLQSTGNVSTMETTFVRSPASKAEWPARAAGSMTTASSDFGALEFAGEDVSVSGQSLGFDMNEVNGHIKQGRRKKSIIVAALPRLIRPKRLSETAASTQSVDVTVDSESSSALASSATANSESLTSLPPPLKIVTELPSKIAELPVKLVKDLPAKVADLPEVVKEIPVVAELSTVVAELPAKAVVETAQILKEQVVDPVVEILPDAVVEQVSSQVDEVSTKVSEQVSEVSSQVLESVTSTAAQVSETVTATVSDVTESVSSTAAQVTETVQATATAVSSTAAAVVDFLISDDDDDTDSDDEFETFKTSDAPEFRGMKGLNNFHVLQEDNGIFSVIYDFYIYMLKKPLPEFALAMFAAPVMLSVVFTFLYLPDVNGLALDDTARNFFDAASGDVTTGGLTLSWTTLFEIFMFSLSLSTGLQPELAPLSPYTLVLANVNALFAQLIFVFLSGAVFARLSQPSQPVRCSTVALICPSLAQRRRRVDSSATKVLMARYVLAGPQPCELVDVKVDLTYKYNTLTRSGAFFRATQSLKLVRSEIAYLNHGMLVRHIIDESSPLYRRTPEMLRKEDSIFTLSVVGLERSSMQSVFHVQHYCVCDNHLIWDAEFEDMMLINKKNKRIVDHSKLSLWRPV